MKAIHGRSRCAGMDFHNENGALNVFGDEMNVEWNWWLVSVVLLTIFWQLSKQLRVSDGTKSFHIVELLMIYFPCLPYSFLTLLTVIHDLIRFVQMKHWI